MPFNEKLNIDDMKKAADNFYKALDFAKRVEAKDKNVLIYDEADYQFEYQYSRSALIHIFEITLERAWKMMQRWVKLNSDDKIVQKPKRELFRVACECGLIEEPVKWWGFYEARNSTSHTYDEEKAEEVYSIAKDFDVYLKDFVARLEERI